MQRAGIQCNFPFAFLLRWIYNDIFGGDEEIVMLSGFKKAGRVLLLLLSFFKVRSQFLMDMVDTSKDIRK